MHCKQEICSRTRLASVSIRRHIRHFEHVSRYELCSLSENHVCHMRVWNCICLYVFTHKLASPSSLILRHKVVHYTAIASNHPPTGIVNPQGFSTLSIFIQASRLPDIHPKSLYCKLEVCQAFCLPHFICILGM